MLEVYAVKQKEKISGLKQQRMLSDVSEEKGSRIKGFLRWEDAQGALIADALIRNIICKKLNLKNDEIIFDKNECGKPRLKNRSNFYFNTSYAGEWIVCAVSKNDVGIDVEKIKPIDFEIARRFFSKEEYEQLLNKKREDRLDYFYDLWTLKEGYIKAVGKGLSILLSGFTISINSNGIFLKNKANNGFYNFRQYEIDKGYKLSVCVVGEIEEEKLIIQTLNEVLENLRN